ncbi:MAG: hypothetical protein ABIT08_09810 [Bacteroidia bacterium]
MIKKNILIFFIFHSFFSFSNNKDIPNFVKLFPHPILPELKISELELKDSIVYLSFDKGVVLYDRTLNKWQEFQKLKGYEKYGKINQIYRWKNHLFILLDKATIIKSSNKSEKLIYKSLLKLFYNNDRIYSLASDTITYLDGYMIAIRDVRKRKSKYKNSPMQVENKNYIFQFNLKNDSISLKETKLKGSLASIHTYEFFENEFWISSTNSCMDCYVSYYNCRISLNGDVIELEKINNISVLIQFLKSYHDTLLIFTDSTIYKYKNDNWVNTNFSFKNVYDFYQYSAFPTVKSYQTFNDSIFIIPAGYLNRNEAYFINFIKSRLDTIRFNIPFYCNNCLSDAMFLKNYFFALFSTQNHVVRYELGNFSKRKYYPIKDFLQNTDYNVNYNEVRNIAEDKKEIWLCTQDRGIYRYQKKSNKWQAYSDYIEDYTLIRPGKYATDTTGYENLRVFVEDITLSENYIFFNMVNDDNQRKYLIFDRKANKFNTYTENDFRNEFVFNKIEKLIYSENKDLCDNIVKYAGSWATFLFFNKISGNSPLNITGEDYAFVSYYKLDGSDYGNCIVEWDYKTKKLLNFKIPHTFPHFQTSCIPYNIAGNKNAVWIHGWCNDNTGLIKLYTSDGSIQDEYNIAKDLKNLRMVKYLNHFLVIYKDYSKLIGYDLHNLSVFELSSSAWWMSVASNYVFWTDDGKIFYYSTKTKTKDILNFKNSDIVRNGNHFYISSKNEIMRLVEK